VLSYIDGLFLWQHNPHRTSCLEEHCTVVDPDIPGDTCTKAANSLISHPRIRYKCQSARMETGM